MNTKVTQKDILWNYAGIFMSMSSSFILLPFIVYYLSEDVLGLWYVFLSIGGIVALFDFGFNPTLARNIAYCWNGATSLSKENANFKINKEPNIKLLKTIIITCKKIYLIIAGSALIILFTIGSKYIWHIAKEIEGNTYKIAWIIYSIAVFLNLYYGYYITFLRGVGAVLEVNKASVYSKVAQLAISIILLKLNLGILAVSIAYLISGIIFRTIAKKYFYNYRQIGLKLQEDKNNIRKEDIKDVFSKIWNNAWKDGVVSISSYITSQASTFICSMYLSLSETGIYSLTLQLVTAIVTVSGALYTAYQPSLQAAFIRQDSNASKTIMSTAMVTYYIMYWMGIVGIIVITPILMLIKPGFRLDIMVFLLMAIYMFLLKHHCYYASYISNTNSVPYMKAFIVSGVLGIILSIILVKYFSLGAIGLVLGQMIVQLFYNNWIWPYKVLKSLNINLVDSILIGKEQLLNYIFNIFKSRNVKQG